MIQHGVPLNFLIKATAKISSQIQVPRKKKEAKWYNCIIKSNEIKNVQLYNSMWCNFFSHNITAKIRFIIFKVFIHLPTNNLAFLFWLWSFLAWHNDWSWQAGSSKFYIVLNIIKLFKFHGFPRFTDFQSLATLAVLQIQ